MGQARTFGVEETHGTYIRLLQGLGGNALQQGRVGAQQRGRRQRRQLFGDHLPALQQLALQARQLHPGEIAAEHQCQQAGRQQGEHEYAAFDA
ncbi:hypothetical protein D9M68_863050 [compost metagenome]